jgi:hypothetical protein
VGGQFGERLDRLRLVDLQQEVAQQRIEVAVVQRFGASDGFELEQDQAVPDVAEHVEVVALDRDRGQVKRAVAELVSREVRCQAFGGGADHGRQRPAASGLRLDTDPVRQIGTGLQDLAFF